MVLSFHLMHLTWSWRKKERDEGSKWFPNHANEMVKSIKHNEWWEVQS